jgi:hypothetical protein
MIYASDAGLANRHAGCQVFVWMISHALPVSIRGKECISAWQRGARNGTASVFCSKREAAGKPGLAGKRRLARTWTA